MTKLLFYINKISDGGAERVMANLANSFIDSGFSVVLVTSFRSENEYFLNPQIKYTPISEYYLQGSFWQRNRIGLKGLRKICIQEKPDIVISFMAENNFRAILATRFLNIRTLLSIRNDPKREYASLFFKLASRLLYPFGSGFVFQTTEAQQWFPKSIRRRSAIILNPVDESFYVTTDMKEDQHIVAAGRLDSQKNYPLLIRAFAEIAADFPEQNLLIFGQGPLKSELLALIDSHHLHDRVKLQGYTLDVAQVLKSAKLYVLSSDYEGLPNALMEAMALGRAVISTDCPCGGPRTLVTSNINGLLVPVGDQTALAEAMRKILADDQYRLLLAQNARIKAEEFSPRVIFDEWKAYINNIIA